MPNVTLCKDREVQLTKTSTVRDDVDPVPHLLDREVQCSGFGYGGSYTTPVRGANAEEAREAANNHPGSEVQQTYKPEVASTLKIDLQGELERARIE